MAYSKLLGQLISALQCLPSVGAKSAQRMAFSLLEGQRHNAHTLSAALLEAADNIQHCSQCRNLSELTLCDICSSSKRDSTIICVVESPADVQAFEDATNFTGHYFVLMGHLSPLDGIGPEDIGLDMLAKMMDENTLNEIILATNPTVEGEATAHYVSEMAAKRNIKATRIAHGVPFGGELEYVNNSTLALALSGRSDFN